jgi:hypothetical protein
LSLVLARKKSTILLSGLLFAALLCLKHIYLYLAPAYFVFLLRAYCLGPKFIFHVKFGNAFKLGTGIIAIFGAAFGPFAYWGQIPQLLSRLFPFSRGLCHAYWAPNVWALYSLTDRVLIYGMNLQISLAMKANSISGTSARSSSQSRCSQQCYSRSCRRHFFRCTPGNHRKDDIHPHSRLSDHPSLQAVLRPIMGHLHRSRHALWLCILPVWLARP